MNRHQGQCSCGATQYLILGNKPKELYGDTIFFNDAQLLWERGEENINHAGSNGTKNPKATCKTCHAFVPIQSGSNHVFLPAATLDSQAFLDYKQQIAKINPKRRSVRLNFPVPHRLGASNQSAAIIA